MKVLLTCLVVSFVLMSCCSKCSKGVDSYPELEKADGLFKKGTFQEALEEYENACKKNEDPDVKWRAFHRACECLTHLYRYGDAAQKLLDTPPPGKMPLRARILLLKAEILQNFMMQYAHIQGNEIIDEEGGGDVFRLTRDEVKEKINETYRELWKLRGDLVEMDLKDEGYFLDIEGVDFGAYPTMFDYLIYSWTDYVLAMEAVRVTEKTVWPDGTQILVDDFKKPVRFDDSPGLLAAELMEEAGRFETKGRKEASERWKASRLSLLRWNIFEVKDYDAAAEKSKKIFLEWFDEFDTKGGRAQAGYAAAEILRGKEEYVEAVKLCKRVEKLSGTYHAYLAMKLREGIQEPSFFMEARTVMPPAEEAFKLETRNLDRVYFKAYKIDPDDMMKELKQFNFYFSGWSGLFNYPHRKWLEKVVPKKKPLKRWDVGIDDRGEYKTIATTVDPPALDEGIYLVLASEGSGFKIDDELVSACFLNVTDFVLIGTPGVTKKTRESYYEFIGSRGKTPVEDDVMRFYALDGKTGDAVEGAGINVWLTGSVSEESVDVETDENGVALLPLGVGLTPPAVDRDYYYHPENNFYFNPLARKDKAFSYWRDQRYFNYIPPKPLSLFLETDRPIYRPGHKVSVKVVAVRKTQQGFKTIGKNRRVDFTVYDPNGKEFFKENIKLCELGSASVSFEIPPGRLLGAYRIEAACRDGRFTGTGSLSFSVEEYKQPEFEIELEPAEKPWKYDKPVNILGSAKYYFGGPVTNASIRYIIKRRIYVPWYYRYWLGDDFMESDEELVSGEMKTDDKGGFVISFTPTSPPTRPYAGKIPDMAEFIIDVEGRDAGGRTIESRQVYRAGANALYFVIEPEGGFFLEKEPVKIDSKLLTVNDSPSSGSGGYEIFSLADEPTKPLDKKELNLYSGQWGRMPPLDVQLKDAGNGKRVAEGSVEYSDDGRGAIRLSPLPGGTYRIVLTMKGPWGGQIRQEKIFVVAGGEGKAATVNAASVTLVEKDEYKTGDMARFVLGSGLGSGIYYVEVWAGEYLLKTELVRGKQPVRLYEMPVTAEVKGGFTLRWFGVKDLEVHYGKAAVSVPWSEKKLAVSLEPFKKKLAPGEKTTWGIDVKDSAGRPAKGEVLALMYDRALEYYVTSQGVWLDALYVPGRGPGAGADSAFEVTVSSFYVEKGIFDRIKGLLKKTPGPPKPPGLRTWSTWAGGRDEGGLFRSVAQSKSDFALEEQAPLTAAEAEAPAGGEAPPPAPGMYDGLGPGKTGMVSKRAAAASKVETRKAFADTAFFYPHIETSAGGTGKFTFTAPEQLTSWRIKLFAFTTDVKEGTCIEEAVTKKDLMVRADIPRFFREKDKGTVTAVVHNESEKVIKGDLFIDVTEEGLSINDKVKLGVNRKQFEIQPHDLASFNWMLEIPEGISTYKVRVAAVAGKLTDAEERELPILPSRQRLIESAFITLAGSESKKLEIKMEDDPTRINESMAVQVDPQLMLSLLNTIPFLLEYPYECVEQILNRYVPLAIVNEIYKEYPAVRKAVSKIPKRETVTPAWEQDDPRRLITLMETPWVRQSEGYKSTFPMIDLLDPSIVNAQKEISLARLKAAQLPSGAFPWFPGGYPDVYMTLYVLAGFAEAKRYGVELPDDMISRALRYVGDEIPKRLKKEPAYLAITAYAAYVVTSYSPKEYAEAAAGHKEAKSWVKFLHKHVHALTPLGKAYLAYTYHRLGDKKKSGEVLDMALDGAKEDPIVGVYWAPEKYSWVWYCDTVEKHSFFLKMLQELRPNDKKIPGMVQWLLFNRKGNVWKSTKASSAAVYALLDYLNQTGALASKEVFNIKWGKISDTVVVKPDDWLEEPIRWIEEGFAVTPDMATAVVKKEGKGLAFASMTWIYSTDRIPEASSPGLLMLQRKFYRRVKEGDTYHLKPVKSGEQVFVGDEVVVQLKINAKSRFEYMHLKDPKAAGFEAETLLSGWKYKPLQCYEEPRDSLTNFFVSWLPHGEFILSYTLRPTKPGTYRVGASMLQSMYAPEMTAHSAGFVLKVVEK